MNGSGELPLVMSNWNLTDAEAQVVYVNNILYYSLVIPLAVCGNIFTLSAVAMVLKLKSSIPNLLIGVLACTDLFSILACHLISLISMMKGYYVGSTALCYFQSMMTYSYFKMGFLTKCCISLDRFVALAFPLKYRRVITMKKMVAVIIHNVIFSFGSSALTLILDGEHIHVLPTWPMCVNNFQYYTHYKLSICVVEGAIFTLGVILFFVSNITVIKVVRQLNRKTKALFSIGKVATVESTLTGKTEITKSTNVDRGEMNNNSNASQPSKKFLQNRISSTESLCQINVLSSNDNDKNLHGNNSSNCGTMPQNILQSGANGNDKPKSENKDGWRQIYEKIENKKLKRQRKEIQLAKLVTVIVTVFVILWLPYMTVIYWEHANRASIHPIIEDIVIKLVFANSCINPILYGVFNANFRRAYIYYLKMLAFYFMCKMMKKPQGRRQSEYAITVNNEY